MQLTISEIARTVGYAGTLPQQAAGRMIDTLLIDSRAAVASPRTAMFFALRTPGNDGHRYVRQMWRAGVRAFMVEEVPPGMESLDDTVFVTVASAAEALRRLGAHARAALTGTVVGITGSRGKTVVKEMLWEALHGVTEVARSPRSWNSQIGVPLSLWGASPTAQVVLIEAGVSQPGEMERLAAMVRPEVGVLTSLTDEHRAAFGSAEEQCRQKALLFEGCKDIVYDSSDALAGRVLAQMWPAAALHGVDCSGLDAESADRALSRAVLGCLGAVGREAVLTDDVRAVETRIDVHEGLNDCLTVYDRFTCDLESMALALDFVARRATAGRELTVVAGDMRHGREDAAATYAALASLLEQRHVDRLVGIGPEISSYAGMFAAPIRASFHADAESYLRSVEGDAPDRELILIKGDTDGRFDELSRRLAAPRHETVMEINLDAVVHNFNLYRAMLPAGTGMVGMVKASAYGTGALEIAKTLQSQGAAYLAVAVVDEGVALRRAGITMPVMVLNPMGTNYEALFGYRLEPAVFSLRELEVLVAHASRRGVKDYPVHVKLDTGMHRVGFLEGELDALASALARTDTVRVASAFSHLATADCLDMDDYTDSQLEAFASMTGRLRSALGYDFKRHVLNTAGIMRRPAHHYDMVRLGIGLYGVAPYGDSRELGLRPVARFASTIISIKEWDEGITVGYGRRGVIRGSRRVIATVAAGYADGINRHLGCGAASFVVNGVKCPTVGNICMDQCMIDVTGAGARVGDRVVIYGPEAPVEDLAAVLGTIPYELLTSVSPRVSRVYYRE